MVVAGAAQQPIAQRVGVSGQIGSAPRLSDGHGQPRRWWMARHAAAGRGFIRFTPPPPASAALAGAGHRAGLSKGAPPFSAIRQPAPGGRRWRFSRLLGGGHRAGKACQRRRLFCLGQPPSVARWCRCRRRSGARRASFVISTGDSGDTGDNGGFLRVLLCPRWLRSTGDTGDHLGGLGGAPCAPPGQEVGGSGHASAPSDRMVSRMT